MLRQLIGERRSGPVFVQRRCQDGHQPLLIDREPKALERELLRRVSRREASSINEPLTRAARLGHAKTLWRDLGGLKEDWVRKEFMQLTKAIGLDEVTAPKTLRHTFATTLQDANVDPLIRNELMGHTPAAAQYRAAGWG